MGNEQHVAEEDDRIKQLVARRLRALREEGGYPTAAKFAEQIGVDAPRLSRMENGHQGISTLTLRRAARVLGVDMEAFFQEPAAAVTHMRAGEGRRSQADAMVQWARELRADLELVRRYQRGLG
jgi:transcriptional regulator with XRE-family HTH domain